MDSQSGTPEFVTIFCPFKCIRFILSALKGQFYAGQVFHPLCVFILRNLHITTITEGHTNYNLIRILKKSTT